jgi:hypothetical protein
MIWRAATLTLSRTARDGGMSGVLSIGDDIAFDVRNWRRVAGGVVRCEMSVSDPAWQAFLNRLLSRPAAG